jgi:hypothetical protein
MWALARRNRTYGVRRLKDRKAILQTSFRLSHSTGRPYGLQTINFSQIKQSEIQSYPDSVNPGKSCRKPTISNWIHQKHGAFICNLQTRKILRQKWTTLQLRRDRSQFSPCEADTYWTRHQRPAVRTSKRHATQSVTDRKSKWAQIQ